MELFKITSPSVTLCLSRTLPHPQVWCKNTFICILYLVNFLFSEWIISFICIHEWFFLLLSGFFYLIGFYFYVDFFNSVPCFPFSEDDYESFQEARGEITGLMSQRCHNLTVVDDNLVESQEELRVSLMEEFNVASVSFSPATTTITIQDDDSEHLQWYLQNFTIS